jgi:hypothetical protein
MHHISSVIQWTIPILSQVCNACGIYERVNNNPRPLKVATRKKFTRTPRSEMAAKRAAEAKAEAMPPQQGSHPQVMSGTDVVAQSGVLA